MFFELVGPNHGNRSPYANQRYGATKGNAGQGNGNRKGPATGKDLGPAPPSASNYNVMLAWLDKAIVSVAVRLLVFVFEPQEVIGIGLLVPSDFGPGIPKLNQGSKYPKTKYRKNFFHYSLKIPRKSFKKITPRFYTRSFSR